MKNLLDIIVYIFCNYEKVEELSKPRLVKLIYLIDWKYTIDKGEQFTDIKWYFNHYGPYVDDVINLIRKENDIFNVESYINQYGGSSDRISMKKDMKIILDINTKNTADFILKNTVMLNWTDFISLVYSTYPIKTNPKYTFLDLKKDAKLFSASKN